MLHVEAGMVPLQLPQSFQIRYHATVQLTWVVVFDKSVPIFRAPTTEQNRMNYQSLCDFLHLHPRQVTQAYCSRFKLLAVAAYFPRAYHFSHSTPPLVRDVYIIGGVSLPAVTLGYLFLLLNSRQRFFNRPRSPILMTVLLFEGYETKYFLSRNW